VVVAEASRTLHRSGSKPKGFHRAIALAESRKESTPGVVQGRKSKHDMSSLRKKTQRRESSAAAMSLMKRGVSDDDEDAV
jgi:hypothetical protein